MSFGTRCFINSDYSDIRKVLSGSSLVGISCLGYFYLMNTTDPTLHHRNSTMQECLVLEEAKTSPYFLLGVISKTFGIVAYGTLEFGSGCEIEDSSAVIFLAKSHRITIRRLIRIAAYSLEKAI